MAGIEYGRLEWRDDPDAAYAEAVRRIAFARDAEDPEDREAIWFSDLGALKAIPPGLGEATGLRRLFVGDSRTPDGKMRAPSRKIEDFAPLAEATALTVLNLVDTGIADISPLAGLSALQSLSLSGTQVADISPLAGLSALQSLSLSGTQVADISPLAGLSALQSLNLSVTQVADFSPLAGLSALQSLNLSYLSYTRVVGISPLAGLSALQSLDLRSTRVTDISPLAGISALKDLSYVNTPAAKADRRLYMLSNLPSKDCAAQTLLYLNGEHPDFRPPERVATLGHARSVLAEASPVEIVPRDGRMHAVDRGRERPARLNPEERRRRLEAQAARVAILLREGGTAQIGRRALNLLGDYRGALAAPDPMFLVLDVPMSMLRAMIDDAAFKVGLDVGIAQGLGDLVENHAALEELSVPPAEERDVREANAPPLRDDADLDAAAEDIEDAIEVLESEDGQAVVDESVLSTLKAIQKQLERIRLAVEKMPGAARVALIAASGTLAVISDAAGALPFLGVPSAADLVTRLQPYLDGLLKLFLP